MERADPDRLASAEGEGEDNQHEDACAQEDKPTDLQPEPGIPRRRRFADMRSRRPGDGLLGFSRLVVPVDGHVSMVGPGGSQTRMRRRLRAALTRSEPAASRPRPAHIGVELTPPVPGRPKPAVAEPALKPPTAP